MSRIKAGLTAIMLGWPSVVLGQIDYRNTDHSHPLIISDAYSIERGALEIVSGVSGGKESGQTYLAFAPGLEFGLFPNFQVGIDAEIARANGNMTVSSELRGLWTLWTDGRKLPALALTSSLDFPAEGKSSGTVGLALTRNWGLWRTHTNLATQVAGPGYQALIGADYTLWRQSVLLMGETGVVRQADALDNAGLLGFGLRAQLTPSLVLDLGARHTFQEAKGLTATAGFSYSISTIKTARTR